MKNSRPWMNSDVAALRVGRQPHGRTYRACMMFCIRHGIPFPGKKAFEENKELDKKFTQPQGIIMTKSKPKNITASVKDAKAVKKPAAVKAAKPVPEPEKAEERAYNFRVLDVKNVKASDNIREVKDIEDLLNSIHAHGIVNPITVLDEGNQSFKVIAGFRRFAAAVQLGLKKIPCHVMLKDREGVDEISLTENITRMDMTPYEECMAVKALSGKKKTPAAIAKHFGRTLRWVLVRKKLADAGDKVLKKVKEGVISLDAAAKIADLPDNVFKRELESCYRTDKYFIDGVLDRYHKDLSRAPFEHEACLKCDKCSACQADLFENEPKAYCLDPNCWARKAKKAAEAKVKKLQEEGRNARIGKFSSYGVDCMDEADKYEIVKYDSSGQKQANEAGIQKRVLVDATTLKTYEYFDKRDLPDYHEETDEEREERLKLERMDSRKKSAYEKLMRERLQDAIASICVDFQSQADIIVTLLVFVAENNYEFFDDDAKKIIGIDGENEYGDDKGIDEMPEDKSYRDVANAVRFSIGNIVKLIRDINTLKKLYRAIGGNVDHIAVTDEEVDAQIKFQDELKAKDDSESNDNHENEEDE
ncbi:MAG: ParB/RepB/Spo0J family partition protein [Fibrobacter sp.]|nr:ParB/RepB/Spo0J family partition protein [Fibrobacter sp.]